MYIYIMRHGETAWNKAGKIQGSSDIDLTDEGKERWQSFRETASAGMDKIGLKDGKFTCLQERIFYYESGDTAKRGIL